jgi:hypothetical protein
MIQGALAREGADEVPARRGGVALVGPRAAHSALVRIFHDYDRLEARSLVFSDDLVRAHAVQAELAVPPYLDVADLRLLAHEAHDGAQKLAHAFRRRVLLEFQRAEDLALRGRRRGEGDDEVSNAARHDLPSRPTRKTRGRVSRPAMIGNKLIAFGQLDQERSRRGKK